MRTFHYNGYNRQIVSVMVMKALKDLNCGNLTKTDIEKYIKKNYGPSVSFFVFWPTNRWHKTITTLLNGGLVEKTDHWSLPQYYLTD